MPPSLLNDLKKKRKKEKSRYAYAGKRHVRAVKIFQTGVFYLLRRENSICGFLKYRARVCLIDAHAVLREGGKAQDGAHGESSV